MLQNIRRTGGARSSACKKKTRHHGGGAGCNAVFCYENDHSKLTVMPSVLFGQSENIVFCQLDLFCYDVLQTDIFGDHQAGGWRHD